MPLLRSVVEEVRIIENWQTHGHYVVVIGRSHPGAPRGWLNSDGEWVPFEENATAMTSLPGFRLPEGALDAIVAEHVRTAAPQPATERHLTDAIAVRDRLLALVEKRR